MADLISGNQFNEELVQLQSDYQALTGFKWLWFKLTSWNLASALDTFEPADADSVRHLYTVYEESWFPWLSGLFDLFTGIKGLLFHRLLSHFGVEDELNILSHPKSDEVLSFSEQFGGIHEREILEPLLQSDDLFVFVKDKFEHSEHNIDELRGTIQLKVGQLTVLNQLATKTGQPVSRFMNATVEQVHLYTALLEQQFSAEELLSLVANICALKSPQNQIDLVALFKNRPGIFHGHRDNIFKSIILNPDIFTHDIQFFTKLDLYFPGNCSDEQCKQMIEDKTLRAILNRVLESDQADKGMLVREVMVFPAKQALFDLMKSNPTKGIALLDFSAQFQGIRDKEIIDSLFKHDFLFDFVQGQFTANTSKEIEALKRTINVKLSHLKVWETVAAKTNTPIHTLYKSTDDQTALYDALLQQSFEADVDNKLLTLIQSLPSTQRQIKLLELYQSRPVLFHAYQDDVFTAILETPDSVAQETDFVQGLLRSCTEAECQLIIDDKVLKEVVQTVMNCQKPDEASLIQKAMTFSNKNRLLELIKTYPNCDVSHFLMLQQPAMTCINLLENGDFPDDLKSTLDSSDKAGLFFYLLNIVTKSSEMGPLVKTISKNAACNHLLEILIQLKQQNCINQSSFIATFNAFAEFSQLNEWRKIAASSWINQELIQAVCKNSKLSECVVYLFQQYPDLQLHKDITFIQNPNQFKDLCIALKDILKGSDINQIIINSTLRELLTIVSKQKGLRAGLVEALESHESTFEILQVMKHYPNLNIDLLIKLDRMSLNKIFNIKELLDEVEIAALLQPDRFSLFSLLTNLNQSHLEKMSRMTSGHAIAIRDILNSFVGKKWFTSESHAKIFENLAKRNDLTFLNSLLNLGPVSTLFDASIDNLFRLFELDIKNTSLDLVLISLNDKKVLTPANLFGIIQLLADQNIFDNDKICDSVEEILSEQSTEQHKTSFPAMLTSENAPLVLKLLINTSLNGQALDLEMVMSLLKIVHHKELLVEIANHREVVDIIKAIVALKRFEYIDNTALTTVLNTIQSISRLVQITKYTTPVTIINAIKALQAIGIVDDEVVRQLVESEDFMKVYLLLQQHGQLNVENIHTLMASALLVKTIVGLDANVKLTGDMIGWLIAHNASTDFCETVAILQKHDQLNEKNVALLMTSSHLVKVCLMLQQRFEMNGEILEALMSMLPVKAPYLIGIIDVMDKNKLFKADAKRINEVIYKVVTHYNINNLFDTLSSLPVTQSNVIDVYWDIIQAPSLNEINRVIEFLNVNFLSSGTKAVENFNCLLEHPELFTNDKASKRLSKALATSENRQAEFDTFMKEFITPKPSMFNRITSIFAANSSESVAASSSTPEKRTPAGATK